ncbi:hypothetical protein SAMN06265795_102414 [Noviherbaspirillum humi]|uniref:PXPV repeat-containing protein n=1 Tax=Noviherbaspirillum humi TaxID=1688639 RepID=A0A239DZA3_9BURK|nr:hypothetical protein [Noviherbaspirillum humi]SNS37032.1 hypothetical protein SAMN06265795_102414 [Noviherbaspirillum humi]
MKLSLARFAKFAIALGLVAGTPLAFANGHVNWSVNVGTAFPAPRPVYVPPPQVYVQPQPSVTYIDPRQPVYVGPTYYQTQPAYVAPPVVVVPPGAVLQYGPPHRHHHHHYHPQPYYRYGY